MIIGISGYTEDPNGNTGSKAAGKDTVADILVEHYGFVKVALADPIKRAAMEWWDFTEDQLWGASHLRDIPDERYLYRAAGCLGTVRVGWADDGKRIDAPNPKENQYLTPRHALQQIGTEVARAVDKAVWVRYALRVAKELLEDKKSLMYSRTEGVVQVVEQTSMGEWVRDDAPATPYKGVVIPDCRFNNELEQIGSGGKVIRVKRKMPPFEQSGHASERSATDLADAAFDWVIDNDGDLHLLKLKVDAMMARFNGRVIPYDAAQADVPPMKRK